MTYYLYKGGALLAELDGGGNVVRQYTWGVAGLVSDTSGANGQTRLYVFDGLGNTRALVDAGSGAILWQGAWTAWGQPNGSVGVGSAYGWHGQTGAYLDGESGLLKMGARYYAPCVGRFLTRDPSGFSAGTNLYGFCLGDPIDFFDPNGCFAIDWTKLLRGVGTNVPGVTLGSLYDDMMDPVGALKRHNPVQPLLDLPGAATDTGTAQGRYDTGKIGGGELAAYYGIYGLKLASAAMTIYGAGKIALPCRLGGTLCFVAGTLVWVAEKDKTGQWHTRSKPIEMVKAGEYVIARNETTGVTSSKKVLQTTVKLADVTVSIRLAEAKSGRVAETITASREHPFYVEGKGFVPAGALAIGNSIVTRAGPALVVKSVTWKRRAEGYDVYNFVVEDDHSYFVGNVNGGVWVHNPSQYQIMRAAHGGLAEEEWRQQLSDQGIQLKPKSSAYSMGPDAEWTGTGPDPGWDFAEIKPHTRANIEKLQNQVRDRFDQGYTGRGAAYTWDGVPGKFKIRGPNIIMPHPTLPGL